MTSSFKSPQRLCLNQRKILVRDEEPSHNSSWQSDDHHELTVNEYKKLTNKVGAPTSTSTFFLRQQRKDVPKK